MAISLDCLVRTPGFEIDGPVAVYERHKGLAERLARSLFKTTSHHDAEDALQEARKALYLAAVNYDHAHDSEAEFETFAYMNIRRALTDFRRHLSRNRRSPIRGTIVPLGCLDQIDVVDPTSLSGQAQYEDWRMGLPTELGDLFTRALLLRYAEGLGIYSVGQRMGLSYDQAAYLLRCARTRLRELISDLA